MAAADASSATVARRWGIGAWVAVAGLLLAAWLARHILLLLVLAVLLAHALAPAVELMCEPTRIRGRTITVHRGLAAALVVIVTILALVYFLSLLVPILAADLTQMLSRVPQYLQNVQAFVAKLRVSQAGVALPDSWWEALDRSVTAETSKLAAFFGRGAFALLRGTLQILGLIVIPILSFHVLMDGPRLVGWVVGLVPARRRASVRGLFLDVDRALAAYVRGQALVCLVMGVTVSLVLTVIQFPYAPLLGTVAAIAEAVPYIGALAVEVLLAVVGLSVSPTYALLGPGVYLVVNQLLGFLVTPQLMGRRLSLHPIAVILAVLLGAELAGIAGMLLALPTAAVVKVLLDRWRVSADAPT